MQPKSILDTLKSASIFDLFLVSFLVLPFVLTGWIDVIQKINLPGLDPIRSLAGITVIYIFGIIVSLVGTQRDQRKIREIESARLAVRNYLLARPDKEKVSFNRIQSSLGVRFTYDLLDNLILQYNKEFFRGAFKDDNPAIGLIVPTGQETADSATLPTKA